MAGDAGADLEQAVFEARRRAVAVQLLGEVADQRLDVGLGEQGRDLADQHSALAEGFEGEADPGKLVAAAADQAGGIRVELDHFGDQQRLPLDAAIGEAGFQPFIDQPLMRGVLVDDNDGMAGLGDDVGAVELGARGSERVGGECGRGRFGGRGGVGADGVEPGDRRLPVLGKATAAIRAGARENPR